LSFCTLIVLLNFFIKNISVISLFFLFFSLCKILELSQSKLWLNDNLWSVTTEKLPDWFFILFLCSLILCNLFYIPPQLLCWLFYLSLSLLMTLSNFFQNSKSNVDKILHDSLNIIANVTNIRNRQSIILIILTINMFITVISHLVVVYHLTSFFYLFFNYASRITIVQQNWFYDF